MFAISVVILRLLVIKTIENNWKSIKVDKSLKNRYIYWLIKHYKKN